MYTEEAGRYRALVRVMPGLENVMVSEADKSLSVTEKFVSTREKAACGAAKGVSVAASRRPAPELPAPRITHSASPPKAVECNPESYQRLILTIRPDALRLLFPVMVWEFIPLLHAY